MPQFRISGTIRGYKMTSGETLTALRFVKFTASTETLAAIAATTDKSIGLLLEKTARTDIQVPVQLDGVCKCEAGDAVTIGSEVKIDSVGRVVDSAHAAGDSIVGQAIEAATAAGEYILVKIAFQDVA